MAWQDFSNETTEDLVELISWMKNAADQETAEDAFRAFCFRFGPELQKTCRQICRNWGYDVMVGDDITEKTLARFAKYPKYDHKKCRCGDAYQCVLLYLYKIAQRLLTDHASLQGKPANPYNGDEEIITEFPDIEAMELPGERKAILLQQHELIQEALNRLSPKHKIIYLTYKQYEEDGFKLPRTLLEQMRRELGLTQASIRVYKNEAYHTIEEYLKVYGKK